MDKVYIIEIDESSAYEKDVSIYSKAFISYDKAKEFLLVNFDCYGNRDAEGEYFSLKDEYQYSTEFSYGTSAVITELDLI